MEEPLASKDARLKEEVRGVEAVIPREQKFAYRIKPISGGWMNAEVIGQQITAIAKLMKACANEDGPRMAVVMTGASMSEARELEFEFAILPYKDKSISKNRKSSSSERK